MIVRETMDAEINNVIYMELNSGPKIANSTCGKTIIAGTIDRDSTVFVLLTRYCLGNQTGNDVMDWAHGTYYKLHTVFEWGSLKVRDRQEDLGVDQKTELKRSCKQMQQVIAGYLRQAW